MPPPAQAECNTNLKKSALIKGWRRLDRNKPVKQIEKHAQLKKMMSYNQCHTAETRYPCFALSFCRFCQIHFAEKDLMRLVHTGHDMMTFHSSQTSSAPVAHIIPISHILPSPGVRISLSSRTPDHALSSAFASSKRTCFWRWNSKLRRPRSAQRSVTGHNSNIHQRCFFFSEAYGSWAGRNMINMGSLQVAQVASASKTVLCHDCLDFEFLQGTSPCHCEAGAHGTLPSNTRVTTVPRSTASTESLASRHTAAAWPNWPNSPLPWLDCHSHGKP